MKLGNIEWQPIDDCAGLVSKPTEIAIQTHHLEDILAAKIDASLSDTAAFCHEYNIDPGICANCVVLQAKRAEKSCYAAILVPAHARADINGIVRRALDARKISFAPMEQAVELTGMEFGAINPIGLPRDWLVLVDEHIAQLDHAVIGSGRRDSKLLVSGKLLAGLPRAQVLKLTKDS